MRLIAEGTGAIKLIIVCFLISCFDSFRSAHSEISSVLRLVPFILLEHLKKEKKAFFFSLKNLCFLQAI